MKGYSSEKQLWYKFMGRVGMSRLAPRKLNTHLVFYTYHTLFQICVHWNVWMSFAFAWLVIITIILSKRHACYQSNQGDATSRLAYFSYLIYVILLWISHTKQYLNAFKFWHTSWMYTLVEFSRQWWEKSRLIFLIPRNLHTFPRSCSWTV